MRHRWKAVVVFAGTVLANQRLVKFYFDGHEFIRLCPELIDYEN